MAKRAAEEPTNDGMTWIEELLRRLGAGSSSDLVLEPDDRGGLRAVIRADGLRREIDSCPATRTQQAIGRLKALASLPAYITDEPQDGRLDGRPFGIPGDIRLAVLPTVRGQRLALRLPALGELPAPDDLGLPAVVVDGLRQALRRPDGLLIVSGPTGAGKTTTLHSLLAELAAERPDRQIISIEDPVERRLPGLAQVEVRPHGPYDFVGALRAALRQDADVIMVGEIRDAETARTAVRAGLAGHLVVATTHAGRAREVLPRLLDMGVEAAHLVAGLRLVLAQRLLRRRDAAAAGGYRGRQVVCDLLDWDADQRQRWQTGETLELATDMDAQAAMLAADGVTDAGEISRVLGSA